MPPPSGDDGAPLGPWDDALVESWQVLAEAREMAGMLRSMGDIAEADLLEAEIRDLTRNIARLLEAVGEPNRDGRAAPHDAARWPTGHLAWIFSGSRRYHAGARSFLAEGAVRNEQLLFAADEPVTEDWPRGLLESGQLRILRTADALGPRGEIVASQEALAASVDTALAEGYSGVRVAADGSSLIRDGQDLDAWIEAERINDLVADDRPLTVMCAFDRTRVSEQSLEMVRERHEVVL